jgi:hypothetical protein
MDKGQELLNDSYSVFVPIEDHDLMKSVSVDENGDFIVQGVMTSDDTDEEDDSITPEGMDCSYFLEKGWIKYEHGKNPEQFIGEPLEVKVGRFEHPTLMKSVNGIFVKGRLFANRRLTSQAIEAMNDLQKSHTKRRMGWSIEGSVKARNKAGKIVKSVLRNVVLTMNPVNTTTWAELAKSFAKDHELWIDTEEPVDKSMDTGAIAEVMPQSLEGAKKKKDPQDEWLEHFRSFVKKALINKSFRNEFVTSAEDAEILAFSEALSKGLDYEEADEFASYIASKHTLLKSLVINFGGENMSKEAENKLASLLDADLEELQKAIDFEDEADADEEEFLSKSIDEEDDKDPDHDGDDDTDPEGDTDNDYAGSEDDDEDEKEDQEDEDQEDEEEDDQKGGKSKLSKSLATDHGQKQAFEVSDFLTAISDEIGFSLEGIEKSMMGVTKQQNTLIKAISTMGEMMKSFQTEITDLRSENEELNKSLGELMNRPVGRKGVVNQREVQTLSKSLDGGKQPKRLSRTQISDELVKSFNAGEITGSVVSRFEAGVPLDQLGLPEALRNKIGL